MRVTKVVFIVEATLGGVRRHVIDLIENIDHKLFRLYVIYGDDRADDVFFEKLEILNKNVDFFKIDSLKKSWGISNLKAIYEISHILRNIKPDIVHCHSSIAGVSGRIAAKIVGVKKIYYTPHAYTFQNSEKNKAYIWLTTMIERVLSKCFTNKTINVSYGERNYALEKKIDRKDKFIVIYNGIANKEFPNKKVIRGEIGLDKNKYFVGTASRCEKQKDPLAFLIIAREIINRNDEIDFLYVGEGEMEGEMKEYIEKNQLQDRIHMLGYKDDAERIIASLDIYLSTSKYEAMPYSLIEATRSGIPIVATNVEGNNEVVIDGVNGLIFNIGKYNEAGDLILYQIKNKAIKENQCRDVYLSRFSITTMIEKTEKLYLEG